LEELRNIMYQRVQNDKVMTEFSAKLKPLRDLLDEYLLLFPDPVNPPYDTNKEARKINKKKFADLFREAKKRREREEAEMVGPAAAPPQETERSVECEKGPFQPPVKKLEPLF
jgi:hypothetical protein